MNMMVIFTISLVSEYQPIGPQTFDGCCYTRGASVGSLLPIDVDVLVGKYGTSYGRDTDGLFFHLHLFDDFSDELVNHAVTASRAVVHGHVVHQSRFLINQIFRFDDIFFHNNLLFI